MINGRLLSLLGIWIFCLGIVFWVGVGLGLAGNEAAAERIFLGSVGLSIVLGVFSCVMSLLDD